jgi:hypothetical protein
MGYWYAKFKDGSVSSFYEYVEELKKDFVGQRFVIKFAKKVC